MNEKDSTVLEAKKISEDELQLFHENLRKTCDRTKILMQPVIPKISSDITKKLLPLLLITCLCCFPVMASEHGNSENHGGGISEIARMINFTVMAGILVILLRKPLSGVFGNRIQNIRQSLDDSSEKLAKINSKSVEIHLEQEKLPEKKQTIQVEAKKQCEQSISQIADDCQREISLIQKRTNQKKEKDYQDSWRDLKEHIINDCFSQAENNINKTITKENDRKLIDNFFVKMDSVLDKKNKDNNYG